MCYYVLPLTASLEQEDLNKQAPVEQTSAKKKGLMGTMMGFVLGTSK